MKNLFPGHFPLSQEELSQLMQRAIFVLDTNVLLNMYRYTEKSRNLFFEIIERLGDRIAIPYQVASEFFDARTKVIQDQNKAIDLMDQAIEDAHNKLKNELNKYRKHAHVDIAKILAEIGKSLSGAQANIREIKEHRTPVKLNDDPILARLAELLADRVLPEPSGDELDRRKKSAEERINSDIPPGFADKGKPGDRHLGDALIWLEAMEISKSRNLPVIFVTDDIKDDWWLRVDGQIIGPLPMLRHEFHKSTDQNFHMYQADNFIKHAAELLEVDVDAGTLSEAAKVSEDQASAWIKEHDVRKAALDQARKTALDLARKRAREILAASDEIPAGMKIGDAWRAMHTNDRRRHLKSLRNPPAGEDYALLLQEFEVIDNEANELGDPQVLIVSNETKEMFMNATPHGIYWVEELNGYFALAH